MHCLRKYIPTLLQCRHLIPALDPWAASRKYTTARLQPSFLGMDACMTSQLKVAFICKLTWDVAVLGLFFDMLSFGYRTTPLVDWGWN